MKRMILPLIAATSLIAGCADSRHHKGAAETDQNVLTGGPVAGTTLKDVPSAVRNTLLRVAPGGEVADIDQTLRNGTVVYEISFTEPSEHPKIYITRDGKVVSAPADHR
jgi:uncharacterized membrane protein YkoI